MLLVHNAQIKYIFDVSVKSAMTASSHDRNALILHFTDIVWSFICVYVYASSFMPL